MSFRRAKSTQGNTDADGAREALRLAFQSADIDRSGMIGAPVRATPPKAPNTNFPQAHHACVWRLFAVVARLQRSGPFSASQAAHADTAPAPPA